MTLYVLRMKRIIPLALLGLLLGGPAIAQNVAPEAAPVASLDAAILAAMKAGSAGESFTIRAKAMDAAIQISYNMALVTQNSVGFLWSTLPATQQAQLISLMGQFTTASYTAQFNAYDGQQLQLLPAEKSLGANKIIETQLISGGNPTELDYVVQNGAQGWRITDVLLGGSISQVAVHQSDFSALVSAGDASKLIAALQAKIAVLQGSAAAS